MSVDDHVIAIDGPAGAGKSTIARALAERLHLAYLDTGAMYRGITLAALRAGLDVHDDVAVADLARRVVLDVGERVLVDGQDATAAIRSPEVTHAVSAIAANSEVRADLRARQQAWAVHHGGGVIEGRDIGTVVFPGARLKVYLTASATVRAERRVAESGGDVDEIAAAIAVRDARDRERADGPLARADGSVTVDTTGLSVDEVLDRIEALLVERGRP